MRRKVENGRIDIRSYEWQRRNWDLFDRVGVVSYGIGTLTYNTLSKAQVIPALLPENPNDDPEPIESGLEVDLVNSLEGPFGGASEIVATGAVNLQIAGESYLLGNDDGYSIYSSEQLRLMGQSTVLMGSDGRISGKLTDDDWVARLWRPHPRFREMPLAPLTAVADDCLEWLLLSRKSRGSLRTRLSAGYMFIPSEIDAVPLTEFVPEEGEEAEDEWVEPYGANMPEGSPLMAELIEVMTAPLKDEDDLAGVVPWLLRGPGDQGQNIKYEPWRRSEEETADHERRLELTRSIATGLDWPVEKILGMGDSSFWNAWEIDQSAFEEHMDPLLQLALRSLTTGWFRIALQEFGGMSEEEARKRILWRDLSAFQKEPDWTTAHEAHEAMVISDEALRRYGRFLDEDAPDEEELERRKPPAPVVAPAEEEAPSADDPGPAQPSDEEGEDVAASAEIRAALTPVDSMQRVATRLAAIDSGLLTRITSAADRELNRALEKAGARMRSQVVNRDEGRLAAVKEVGNMALGRHLGRKYVRESLQLEDADLVPPGTFRALEQDTARWIEQAQTAAYTEVSSLAAEAKRNEEQEEEDRNAAVDLIIGLLTGLAISRLFTSASTPDEGEVPTTIVPPHEVMQAISIAGGGSMTSPVASQFDQGIGNGIRTREWLEEAGFFTEAYRWNYGDPSARNTNFEPHRSLDGIEFSEWSDPALTSRGGWPGVSHYHPQDHGGCLCSYERIFCEAVLAAAEGNPCGPARPSPAFAAEPEWAPTMSRMQAEAWAGKSAIEIDLYHGTADAASVRRDGFKLSQLGRGSGNGGLMGAGHYFAPVQSQAYGGWGSTLTVKAKVDRIAYFDPDSREFWRANEAAKIASFGDHARTALESVKDEVVGGKWTVGELIGDMNDDYLGRIANTFRDETYGREHVIRQVLMDDGYDAVVWRRPGVKNPGAADLPAGKDEWLEIAIFRDDAIVVVDE